MALRDALRRVPLFGQLFGQVQSPPIVITITASPNLNLLVDKTSGYPGDTFQFTGRYLDGDGTPLEGRIVTLYEGGSNVGTSLTRLPVGEWGPISWVAPAEGSYSFYAEAPDPGEPPE